MISFLFFITLLNVLGSIRTTRLLSEYDITEDLNDTIFGIFQTAEPKNIAALIQNVVNSDDVNDTTTPYKYHYRRSSSEIATVKVIDVRITNASSDNSLSRLSYEFLDNKIQLYHPQFSLTLSGEIMPFSCYYDFNCTVRFDRCTISAFRQSNTSNNSFLVELQYGQLNTENASLALFSWPILMRNFERILQEMIPLHMNRNEKLKQVLDELYNDASIKRVISARSHFSRYQHRYHYLIPKAYVALSSYNLRTIVLKRLWDFHSFSFSATEPNTVLCTLLLKDIRGSMILEDVATITTTNLELNFFIESLTISVRQGTNRSITVEAKNYSIIETKLNSSLTEVQSYLMDYIERAIGSSLMPSINFHRTNQPIHAHSSYIRGEMENAIGILLKKKSQLFGKKDTEQLNNQSTLIEDENVSEKWTRIIPFDDKNTSEKSPRTRSIANYYNIYHYQLSFPNLTVVNFISGNQPYPEQIQCPLFDHSKFSHRINVVPSGNLFRTNDKANSIDLNFNFNLPSANVSVIKRNNRTENNSCEFQISNNQEIKVYSLPAEINEKGSTNEILEIKHKIDTALKSTLKQRVSRSIKSMACSSFDVCTRYAENINEFFLHIIDKVMQKCSFRRKKSNGNWIYIPKHLLLSTSPFINTD